MHMCVKWIYIIIFISTFTGRFPMQYYKILCTLRSLAKGSLIFPPQSLESCRLHRDQVTYLVRYARMEIKTLPPLHGGTPGPLDSHYYTWIQRKCPYTLWPTLYDAWRAWRFDEGGSSFYTALQHTSLKGWCLCNNICFTMFFWICLPFQGRINCQCLQTDLSFGGLNTRQPKTQGKIHMYGALEKRTIEHTFRRNCVELYW